MRKNDENLLIQRVPAAAILPLRAAVLRPGLALSEAVFPHDHDAATMHLAAFDPPGRDPVGCLTVRPEAYHDGRAAYRLRGMAVSEDHRARGVGRAMLDALVPRLTYRGGPALLWCNARTNAAGFYQRCGWTVDSPVFDIPTVGPHVKMIFTLCSASANPPSHASTADPPGRCEAQGVESSRHV